MSFKNKFPAWGNEGTPPPEDLQAKGFEGGDKPPAAWMNWLCSLTGKSITELQDEFLSHQNNKENPHKTTAAQVGLDDATLKDKVRSFTLQGIPVVDATSTDGVTYTVDIKDTYDDIFIGLQILMIPKMGSTTTNPQLSIITKNGTYSRPLSLPVTQNTALYRQPANIDFIGANVPILITINANRAIMTGHQVVQSSNLFGAVPIEKGGTAATNYSDALNNLGGARKDLTNIDNNTFKKKGIDSGLLGIPVVNGTSSDGVTYTASVDNYVIELGSVIAFVPNITTTTKSPTLNINGTGAITICKGLSAVTSAMVSPTSENWLNAGRPILLIYHETTNEVGTVTKRWKPIDTRPTNEDIYGTIEVNQGGTGGTTAEEARANLGIEDFVKSYLSGLSYSKVVTGTYTGTNRNAGTTSSSTVDTVIPTPSKIKLMFIFYNAGSASTDCFAVINGETGQIVEFNASDGSWMFSLYVAGSSSESISATIPLVYWEKRHTATITDTSVTLKLTRLKNVVGNYDMASRLSYLDKTYNYIALL